MNLRSGRLVNYIDDFSKIETKSNKKCVEDFRYLLSQYSTYVNTDLLGMWAIDLLQILNRNHRSIFYKRKFKGLKKQTLIKVEEFLEFIRNEVDYFSDDYDYSWNEDEICIILLTCRQMLCSPRRDWCFLTTPFWEKRRKYFMK